MREQLIQYVRLLFAGTTDTGEIQQEILQNTLDKYDDLISQGKSPEAAYRLAICGIGDINEILGSSAPAPSDPPYQPPQPLSPSRPVTPVWKKLIRAVGIFLYIISAIPLFILSELGMATIGLCGTLAIVAVATALMILSGGKSAPAPEKNAPADPQSELQKAINTAIGILSLCVYLVLSFVTHAWWITWLIFPIMAAVKGLVRACFDLKEANKHEN